MKAFLSASVLALTVVGCAQMDAKTRGWLASKVPAYAVVDGQHLEGTAMLFTDRTGTLQLSTASGPNFTVLSGTSGVGYGHTAQGPSAVTWGMEARNAAAYLPVPVAPQPMVVPIAPAAEVVPPSAPATASPVQ